eukprot:3142890-Prymnesium_polylepis.2
MGSTATARLRLGRADVVRAVGFGLGRRLEAVRQLVRTTLGKVVWAGEAVVRGLGSAWCVVVDGVCVLRPLALQWLGGGHRWRTLPRSAACARIASRLHGPRRLAGKAVVYKASSHEFRVAHSPRSYSFGAALRKQKIT